MTDAANLDLVPCKRCKLMMRPYPEGGGSCPPCIVEDFILTFVKPTDSVLDVGSGLGRYHEALHRHVDGNVALLDAYAPYMQKLLVKPECVIHFVGDLRLILPALGSNTFDVVMAIDLIEHLTKEDAEAAILQMKRIAERTVLLFTPDGFMPQDKDHYEMGGDHWQTHRSGWTADDLRALGFSVKTYPNLHGNGQGALFALRGECGLCANRVRPTKVSGEHLDACIACGRQF